MNGFVFSERSRSKLENVHPDLVLVVSRALAYSEIDFAITEGMRSYVRQIKLIEMGRSWTEHSKHLRQSDGYSHAIDVMAVGDLDGDGDIDTTDRNMTWSRSNYLMINDAFKRASSELGIAIRWGGDWDCDGDTGDQAHFDGPHFELRR